MKQNKYSINIENPCSQNYNLMKDSYAGKFCSVCKKSVFDFSKSSDVEIDTILKRYNYQVCAKLRKDQLNKPLDLPKPKTYFSSFLKIISGLMLFGATEKATANTTKSDTFKSVFNEDFRNRISENRLIVKNDTVKRIIRGIVFDSNNLPLPGTMVYFEKTTKGTQTDFDGNFAIDILGDLSNEENLTLVFSYIGYTTQKIEINPNQIPTDLKIFFEEASEIEITIGTIITVEKRKWWQFWKKKYKSE